MAEQHDLIRGYATALLGIAEAEGELDRVSDELFHFAKTVEQNHELRTALTDIAIPAERKGALLDEILGERFSPHTRNIIDFVIAQGRGRELGEIVSSLAELAAQRRSRELAEVRVAVELNDDEKRRLAEALGSLTGKEIDLKVVVDPKVLGGVYAKVGDKVIDGTVRHKLDELKDLLEVRR